MRPSYADVNMVPLKQKSLLDYFAHMERVVDVLKNYTDNLDDEIWTTEVVSSYVNKLRQTLSLLKLRYGVNSVEVMDIDMHLSGMPHRFHIDKILHDIIHCKSIDISELEMNSLKQRFLDIVFTKQICSATILEDIAMKLYRKEIKTLKTKPLLAFNGCYFPDVVSTKNPLYKCHWSCYDASENLMHIYVMLFEYDLELPLQNSSELVAVMEKNCSNNEYLLPIARNIDRDLYHVHPKYIGRKIIGPISSYQFSAKDRLLTNLVRNHGEINDFCVEIFTEHLYSSGEISNVGFDDQFDRNQIVQTFFIDRTDEMAADRGVSRVERDVLMPHTLAQVTGVKIDAGAHKSNQLITF